MLLTPQGDVGLKEERPIKAQDGGIAQKRKRSQRNSLIIEEENLEGVQDGFALSILDPTDNSARVWLIRAILFWGLFIVCGYYITFGANAELWSIGLGATASYIAVIGAYFFESFVLVHLWYESSIGKPMVHWMSWGVFLDIM